MQEHNFSMNANPEKTTLERVQDTARHVGNGRTGFIVQALAELAESQSGHKFHYGALINDEDKNSPHFEVYLAFGETDADVVPEDAGNSFQRFKRMAFTFSPQFQTDSLGLSANYSHDLILQTRFDGAHVSNEADYGYDYNMYQLNDEMSVANAIYAFAKDVAPDRAQEVADIIKGEYGDSFQPDSNEGITFYNRHQPYYGAENAL